MSKLLQVSKVKKTARLRECNLIFPNNSKSDIGDMALPINGSKSNGQTRSLSVKDRRDKDELPSNVYAHQM